jgi:hypothetical protein
MPRRNRMPRHKTHLRTTHEYVIDCSARIARTTLSNTHAPATQLPMSTCRQWSA